MSRTWCTGLLIILWAVLVPAAWGQSGEITGTITLHGCTATANDFVLHAGVTRPYAPSRLSETEAGGVARPADATLASVSPNPVIPARVAAVAGNPRQFQFRVGAVVPGELYRLNIRFLKDSCGPVRWQGPDFGRVLAGGPPVELHGYFVRTRLEILGAAVGRRRPIQRWVGADHLDFTDPTAAVRRLRVQSDLPNVSRIVLQVATRPFPAIGRLAESACSEDDPTVVRKLEFDVNATRDWVELPEINFNQLLLAGRTEATDVVPIGENQLQMLARGAPLYLRAIAVSQDETGAYRRRCNADEDGVSGWLKLAKLAKALLESQTPAPQLRLFKAKYTPPTILPYPRVGDAYCLRVVRPHLLGSKYEFPPYVWNPADDYGWDFIRADGSPYYPGDTVTEGNVLCYPQASSDSGPWPIELIMAGVKLVTGVIDAIGMLVDQASELWDYLENVVIDIAADIITAVGVDCDSACRGLLQTGLTIAMVSAGIPPDLPNFEQLKEQGLQYVATQIADQAAPGVPGSEVLAQKALEYAQESLKQAYEKRGGGGDLPNWLTMDVGIVPGVLEVTLERTPTFPMDPLPLFTDLTIFGNNIFDGKSVELPQRFFLGGVLPLGFRDTLTIPVVLPANTSTLPPFPVGIPDDYTLTLWNKTYWAKRMQWNPCIPFGLGWYGPQPYTFWGHVPLGYLGFLSTPVLSGNTFDPKETTPADVEYCKVLPDSGIGGWTN